MPLKSSDRRFGPLEPSYSAKRPFSSELCSDFEEFAAANAALGKYAPAPLFNTSQSGISRETGFWVKAKNERGRLIGLQAVRLIRINNLSLESYLFKWRDLFRPGDIEVDSNNLELKSNLLQSLRGRTCCYQGELWLHPSYRNQGLAGPFVADGICESVARWDPDYMFGLTLPITSNMRYVKAIGYTGLVEKALIWRDHRGENLREEGLAWCSRESILSAMANRALRSIAPSAHRALHGDRPKDVA